MIPLPGLHDRTTDVTFLWLPVCRDEIAHAVMVTELRFVALSVKHPLDNCHAVAFSDIVDEPLVALPKSAGPLPRLLAGQRFEPA